MLQTLHHLGIQDVDLDTLLYGSDIYDRRANINIFEAVHLFIRESDRI